MFSPEFLTNAGTGLDVFGRLFSAFSELEGGNDERKAAEFQAAQLRQNAGQAMAVAQRQAITTQQQAQLVASRALAVAAAGGGGASDPTVVKIISGIAAEGSYRTSVALYEGEERAREMLNRASAVEYGGKLAQVAGVKNAIGKVVGAGAAGVKGAALADDLARRNAPSGIAPGQSLYQKYGLGGPSLSAEKKTPGWWE